jgi:acetyl-CoA C-acetyltransferase
VVSVEAHSKVADVLDKSAVENLALDPALLRVIGANSDVLAGLEMSAFTRETGVGRKELSVAVRREKSNAMRNPRASYGANLDVQDISDSEPISEPLRKYDRAEFAEAGVVLVLASEKWIKKNKKDAVYVDGLAWRSTTPWFEGGDVGTAKYAEECFRSVLKQARLKGVAAFDVLEVDDTYSYKLFQHLMSLGLNKSSAVAMIEKGRKAVNPSGGSLGVGYLIEANGLHKVLECILQLRGQAGGNQVKGTDRALALSWRGNPTATGAAVALSGGK